MSNVYYKFIGPGMVNRGFTYKMGLNVDSKRFESTTECGPGLYFCDADNIKGWYNDGHKYFAEVKVPNGIKISKFEDKSKASKLEIIKLHDLDTVEGFSAYKKVVNASDNPFEDDYIISYVKGADTLTNDEELITRFKVIIESFKKEIIECIEDDVIEMVRDIPVAVEVFFVNLFKDSLLGKIDEVVIDLVDIIAEISGDNQDEVRSILENKSSKQKDSVIKNIPPYTELINMSKTELINLLLGEKSIINKLCFVSDSNINPNINNHDSIEIIVGCHEDNTVEGMCSNWRYATPITASEISKYLMPE